MEKQFEDAKWIIRSRKSENNRQHNGQKKSVIYDFNYLFGIFKLRLVDIRNVSVFILCYMNFTLELALIRKELAFHCRILYCEDVGNVTIPLSLLRIIASFFI